MRREIDWHIAEKSGRVKVLKDGGYKETVQQFETLRATTWVKVERPFRVVKRLFGYMKVRYRGLAPLALGQALIP